MRHHLRSCVSCHRHIRITESACPFCKFPVPESRKTPPARGTPSRRLGRAVTLATAATVGATGVAVELAACSSDDSSPPTATADASADSGADSSPPVVTPDAAPDHVTAVAAYGGAMPLDAHADVSDAATPEEMEEPGNVAPVDAHRDEPDVVNTAPEYGSPPYDGSEAAKPDAMDAGDESETSHVINADAAYGSPEPEPDSGKD